MNTQILKHYILPLLLITLVAFAWSSLTFSQGIEGIKTSDTTDVFRGVVSSYKAKVIGNANWSYFDILQQVTNDISDFWDKKGYFSSYAGLRNTYIGAVYKVTGNPFDAYQLLVFPLNLIYMFGGFLLFRAIGCKPLLATIITIFFASPLLVPLSGEQFGMGPGTIFSRRHLMTAFVPIVLWLYYISKNRLSVLSVAFLILGAISNLHTSGILLAEILILHYLIFTGITKKTLRNTFILLVCLLGTGFIALGGIYTHALLVMNSILSAVGGFFVSEASAGESLLTSFLESPKFSHRYLFFPWHTYSNWSHLLQMVVLGLGISSTFYFLVKLRKSTLNMTMSFVILILLLSYINWADMKWLIILLITLYIVLDKVDLNVNYYTSLVISIFIVSMLGTLFFQIGYLTIDGFPRVFNQLRASRFVWIPAFMLLAYFVSKLDVNKLKKEKKILVISVLIVVVLMTARHTFRTFIYDKKSAEEIAFYQVAKWAKDNTKPKAKFLVASSKFSIISERRVTFSDKQSRRHKDAKLLTLGYSGNLLDAQKKAKRYRASHLVVKKTPELDIGSITPIFENQYYYLLNVNK